MGAAATSGMFDSSNNTTRRPNTQSATATNSMHNGRHLAAMVEGGEPSSLSGENARGVANFNQAHARLQQLLIRSQQRAQAAQDRDTDQSTSSSSRRHHRRHQNRSRSAIGSTNANRPRSFGGEVLLAARHTQGPYPTSSDSEDEMDLRQLSHYVPFIRGDVRCRMCNKMVPYDDHEVHFVMCLTKPRVTYNGDVLAEDKGECAICLDDMNQGDSIARLPCLCIYHRGCIDDWFKRSRTCPEHPGD